jgi:tetratricopeptide (TPR) repeat protein
MNDSEVHKLLGHAFDLYDAAKYDEAFEVCRAALRQNPDSGAGHALLASIYEKQGDLDAAVRQMKRVVALNPESQADKERLAHLEQRLQFLQADEDFTPPPQPFNLASFLIRPSVLALTSLVAVVALAAWLFDGRQEPGYTPSQQPSASATAAQTPLFTPESAPRTASGGDLFTGGQTQPQSAPPAAVPAPPATVRSHTPQSQPAASPPRRAETPAAPAPAVQPRPAQPQPPAQPEPSVRITRQPATPNGEAAAPPRTGGTKGADYQRMAKQAQENGDTAAARDYYLKAIAAYRQEAGSDGGAFAAQQGIRSSELALRLLDNPE